MHASKQYFYTFHFHPHSLIFLQLRSCDERLLLVMEIRIMHTTLAHPIARAEHMDRERGVWMHRCICKVHHFPCLMQHGGRQGNFEAEKKHFFLLWTSGLNHTNLAGPIAKAKYMDTERGICMQRWIVQVHLFLLSHSPWRETRYGRPTKVNTCKVSDSFPSSRTIKRNAGVAAGQFMSKIWTLFQSSTKSTDSYCLMTRE